MTLTLEEEKKKKKLSFPWLTLSFLGLGVGIAVIWANYTGENIHIVIGAEIILISLGSLLIHNHLNILAKCLLALGISTPFAAATLAPLYYPTSAWFVSVGFWKMFGIGVIPGINVFFLGVFLFTEIDKKTSKRKEKDPPWLWGIDILFRVGSLVTLATVLVGEWNIYTIPLVYGGVATFLTVLIVLIPYRFQAGLRGSGKVMLSLGIGGMLVMVLAWSMAKERIAPSEALWVFLPSLFLALWGLVIILFMTKPGDTSPPKLKVRPPSR